MVAGGSFYLHFRWPNIWQLHLAEGARIFVAFSPVDENHTVLYARFYQKFVRVPLLRSIVNYFGNVSSKVILKQDKRVVVTQVPKKTWLNMGENLFQADLPIVYYRRTREELKAANPPPSNFA
jgi:phenylpropionate dioxygenase-like ring-hydroxylating dioxygenase large terminal subunit